MNAKALMASGSEAAAACGTHSFVERLSPRGCSDNPTLLRRAYGGPPSHEKPRALRLPGAGLPAVAASACGCAKAGGPYQVRTGDLLNAIEALYQLS